MSNIKNQETLLQLQEDWKKGWGRLYQKDAGKMSNQKALYFSAKDFVKMYRSQASQFIIDLIEDKIEVGKFKKFTFILGKTLGMDSSEGELSQAITTKLSEVSHQVEEVLSTKETDAVSLSIVEINSKDAFLKFWFEKLEAYVILHADEHGIQKAIFFACRNQPETQKITEGLFAGIASHISKFMTILKDLLGSKSTRIEDIIQSIYGEKEVPQELKYNYGSVKIRTKWK